MQSWVVGLTAKLIKKSARKRKVGRLLFALGLAFSAKELSALAVNLTSANPILPKQ